MTTFPLSHSARKKFDCYSPRFADISLARELAARINATRDLEAQPQRAVYAGVLASANLLDEIYAHLIARYLEEIEPAALAGAGAYLQQKLDAKEFDALFKTLRKNFDAAKVDSHALEYLIRLRLNNANDALANLHELFSDEVLPQPTYSAALADLHSYFQTLPGFGPDDQSFLAFLFAPLRAYPDSLEAQLRFIMESWSTLVAPFTRRILLSLDVLAEENKPTFHGPGPALVLDYTRAAGSVGMDEFEAFSQDKDWMPSVVLLAKNTYVWLDQLSKKYERHIYRLDMVPDEELDEMAARGFSGLWLIGLWQRSKASQRIKQMCGNPDAVASAYSLHAYDIAWELGGDEGMESLRVRAAKRGIRMASDMVPNHMAIDSRWVTEHPDWFLSLPHNPYPQYSFEGPNLSEDSRCSIFLENHYYSQSDAAVVFRRVDNHSGEERFIYHGNDGTSMPWNDTAQLDYLKPEVREALIQTILHVARQFPIIRFDAAMTLAKRHFHRLWFPTPGEGGAIPTRAEHGLNAEEFDAAMPEEFWREVVNRVATEVPETLLLAEAFWMMEGYFVRTLGMHRVYNSAFMNMLRDEKNAEYRLTLKNTLEFDPDILGRFVNFMNNPDEKTAALQFGKGDKYFGVCTLMATLPGLPMFGHGQLEGYEEKYGMEYPRAYWDETPDAHLIARHEKEIFPILHRRALFAGSENFTLYDFWTNEGLVNEDVFAFSNRLDGERALIVYHNRFADSAGWIRSSVSFAEKKEGGEKVLRQRTLGEALGLASGEKSWCIFRDNVSGNEYLRASRELIENGLFVQLTAYGCHVFLDFREVRDEAGLYARLAEKLKGRGVLSIETALRELLLEPIHTPLRKVCDAALWKQLLDASTRVAALDEFESRMKNFGVTALEFCEVKGDAPAMAKLARTRIENALPLANPRRTARVSERATANSIAPQSEIFEQGVLIAWSIASSLGLLDSTAESPQIKAQRSRANFDEWLLAPIFEDALRKFGLEQNQSQRAVAIARVLIAHAATEKPFDLISEILSDSAAQKLLGINRHEGVNWFLQEGMSEVLDWLQRIAALEKTNLPIAKLQTLVAASEYRVVKLLELARAASSSVGESTPANNNIVPSKTVKRKAPKKENSKEVSKETS